jgi:hypothetical protein
LWTIYESEQNTSALAGTHEINKISDPDEDVKNILAIGWAAMDMTAVGLSGANTMRIKLAPS